MTERDIVGYISVRQETREGDLVTVDVHNVGGVALLVTRKDCCDLREEYNKLSTPIKKKIISVMRIGGSKIKVDFNE